MRHGWVFGTGRHTRGIDADECELKSVLPRVAAAEVRENEEGACDLILVLRGVRAGDERAHEAARGLHVGADRGSLRFVVLVGRIEQSAVQG